VNEYEIIAQTDDLYQPTPDPSLKGMELDEARMLQTHYERQWLDRGMTIKYYAWKLSHKDHFEEPEIEIEKDTYRSYGRNYVSTTNN